MDKDLHVDDIYKQSFNDGYTLAKELGINKESLKNISAGNDRMAAMSKGIDQFEKEAEMKKEREKLLDDLDSFDLKPSRNEPDRDKDKGLDIDI